METDSFKEWLEFEIKSLDDCQKVTLIEEFNRNIAIYLIDEDTIDDVFETPWKAVMALRGQDIINNDYIFVDANGKHRAVSSNDLDEIIDDYGVIDAAINDGWKLQQSVGIDIDNYDITGRIEYLHTSDPTRFSDQANEWLQRGGDLEDLCMLVSDVITSDYCDGDLIEYFEEELADFLNDDEEDNQHHFLLN